MEERYNKFLDEFLDICTTEELEMLWVIVMIVIFLLLYCKAKSAVKNTSNKPILGNSESYPTHTDSNYPLRIEFAHSFHSLLQFSNSLHIQIRFQFQKTENNTETNFPTDKKESQSLLMSNLQQNEQKKSNEENIEKSGNHIK